MNQVHSMEVVIHQELEGVGYMGLMGLVHSPTYRTILHKEARNESIPNMLYSI